MLGIDSLPLEKVTVPAAARIIEQTCLLNIIYREIRLKFSLLVNDYLKNRQFKATIVDDAVKHCSACQDVMKERKFSVTEEQRRQVLQCLTARRVIYSYNRMQCAKGI